MATAELMGNQQSKTQRKVPALNTVALK